MAYYIDLFSPRTHQAFSDSARDISGFRMRQKGVASALKPGDKLICYVTKLSRWIGVFEVKDGFFIDNTPIFLDGNDPFVVRFHITPKVWIEHLENALPIGHSDIWNNLSFTKDLPKKSLAWTAMVRGSLRKLSDADGKFLEEALSNQSKTLKKYPVSETDQRKVKALLVKNQDSKQIEISIPDNEENSSEKKPGRRESLKIQALLSEIGERMGLKIWLPKSDRLRVLEIWPNKSGCLLDSLPLNYDDATLKTIENIDVLWAKGRSVVRAFEVEHTTSIYSGILRMADLMALQPNLNINAHIVAPVDRKFKVLQEISRPVFAFLEKGPLAESCTFISYDSVIELSKEKKLEYMTDSVLNEYVEYAEEADF